MTVESLHEMNGISLNEDLASVLSKVQNLSNGGVKVLKNWANHSTLFVNAVACAIRKNTTVDFNALKELYKAWASRVKG